MNSVSARSSSPLLDEKGWPRAVSPRDVLFFFRRAEDATSAAAASSLPIPRKIPGPPLGDDRQQALFVNLDASAAPPASENRRALREKS